MQTWKNWLTITRTERRITDIVSVGLWYLFLFVQYNMRVNEWKTIWTQTAVCCIWVFSLECGTTWEVATLLGCIQDNQNHQRKLWTIAVFIPFLQQIQVKWSTSIQYFKPINVYKGWYDFEMASQVYVCYDYILSWKLSSIKNIFLRSVNVPTGSTDPLISLTRHIGIKYTWRG